MPPAPDASLQAPTAPTGAIGRRLQDLGIRARMSVLMLFAVAPLCVILITGVLYDRSNALEHAGQEVEQAASLAAEQQARSFDESYALLSALRLSADIGFDGGPACKTLMFRAAAAQPQFRTVGVVDPDGRIVCHNLIDDRRAFGQPALLRALQVPHAPEFQIGRFMFGAVTGKPTIVSALRLPHPDGRIGMLFTSLNLVSFSTTAESAGGGFKSVLAVEPASATVMGQSAVRASLIGKAFPEHPLMIAMRLRPGGGVVETTNFNGRPEIIGFAPLPRSSASGAMVAVGVSRDIVLAAANERATIGIVLALATTLVALGTTWWLGFWSQVRPIRRLATTAEAIGRGTLSARATIGPWQAPELRFLGEALDHMAERLSAADEARKTSEDTLAASESRFRLLAENTADLITRIDGSGRRIFASPACRELLGYEPEELLGGRPLDLAHPDDAGPLAAMLGRLQAGEAAPAVQYRARRRDGGYVWVESSGRPLGERRGMVLSMRDIARRKQVEDELAAANLQLALLARQDGLTGLANRRCFDETLERELARAAREDQPIALLIADVDYFKRYNDTYGHPAGDEVLRSVSRVLESVVKRGSDVAARYGGEEFGAVLVGADVEGALQVAEAFRAGVAEAGVPHVGSTSGVVTVSVGVAVVRPGQTALRYVDVVRQADEALYAAKAAGRNRATAYRTAGSFARTAEAARP